MAKPLAIGNGDAYLTFFTSLQVVCCQMLDLVIRFKYATLECA